MNNFHQSLLQSENEIRRETGLDLFDTQSGYRSYPVDFLLSNTFLSKRYAFEVEVLVRAAWAGLTVLECPIGVTYQPGRARISHFHAFWDNARLSVLHTGLMAQALIPRLSRHDNVDWQSALRLPPGALTHPWRFFKNLMGENGQPLDMAIAAWVGVFVGSLPIIPFGLATIVYLNHRWHLNRLMGVWSSNVCVAPFVPFLCIQVGHLLRHGTWWRTFTRQTLVLEIHQRLWEWLLGAMLIGPWLGLLVAWLVYAFVKWQQQR